MRYADINKLATALEGVPVFGCLPGSPSHRSGVRAGDIILEINGQRVRSLDDYMRAKGKDLAHMETVLYRNGETLTLGFDLDREASYTEADVARLVDKAGIAQAADAGTRQDSKPS